MILICGGIKGGVGKSTIAVNLAILRAAIGKDVLLVDADEQGTASDFTAVRNETLVEQGELATRQSSFMVVLCAQKSSVWSISTMTL
jgi:chromosome partitioning protein